ncbi:MAG TPA: GAF domain-containing protein [Caldilineae bacterium]|nr:GAF domain-containing protein [Caldilineae bacterium]
MSLRRKAFLLRLLIGASLIAVLFVALRVAVLPGFARLENDLAQRELKRTLDLLSHEIETLDAIVVDWASWDDTYAFIQDHNQTYIDSNLVDETYIGLRLNLMVFIDTSGRIVYGQAFDWRQGKPLPISEELRSHFAPNAPLVRHPEPESHIAGILSLPEGLMLIASHPILTSEEKGPVRGALIMGRYLDEGEVERLAQLTRLPLFLWPYDATQAPADVRSAREALSEEIPILVQPLDGETLVGYALLTDIYGAPAAVLKAEMSRTVYQQGVRLLYQLTLSLFLLTAVFIGLDLWGLDKMILRRLERLATAVREIGSTGDLSLRIEMSGQDELKALANAINDMLDSLAKAQKKLQEAEARFRMVTEEALAGVYIIQDDKLRYVNPALARIFGYAPEEIIDKLGPLDLTHPDDRLLVERNIALRLRGEQEAIRYTFRGLRKDGRIIHCEVLGRRVEYQRRPAIIGTLLDVTERVQMEDEVRRWATRLEALNAVIAEANAATELKDFLQHVLDHTMRALKTEMGAIWLVERPGGQAYLWVTRGFPSELAAAVGQEIRATQITISGPQVVEDWQTPEETLASVGPIMTHHGIHASITIPLLAGDEYLGALAVAATRPRRWSAEEVKLVEAVGQQVGTAVQRLRLLQETRRRLQEVALLSKVITIAATSKTLEGALQGMGREVADFLGLPQASFALLNPERSAATVIVDHRAEGSPSAIGAVIPVANNPFMVYIFQHRRPLAVCDAQRDPVLAPMHELMRRRNVASILIVPVLVRGEVIGFLGLDSPTPRTFTTREIELVEQVATEAGRVLERAQLVEELQAALRAKEEMIQNVSHELRTPLTLVMGYAELLQRGDLGALPAQVANAVDVIYRNSERLRFMIDRLLILQTLEPRTFRRVRISSQAWLTAVVARWEGRAIEAGISLQSDLPSELPDIMGDLDLLDQVMDNLLDNAIKFSPKGGSARVSARLEEEELIIAVADQGIGIPPDELERIFERFYQVDGSSTRRFEGMGIGLALCKAIVEGHGGRIWAESKGEGQGSTFYVALPVT